MTLVPFEREAILAEELETRERDWLNNYHKEIVAKIGSMLNEKELAWLKEITAAI